MQIWAHPETYLQDFYARAGDGWDHSVWDFRNPDRFRSDKVHLDVQFSRYRADGSLLGRYRSIWVVTYIERHWAAQLRSSFAARGFVATAHGSFWHVSDIPRCPPSGRYRGKADMAADRPK